MVGALVGAEEGIADGADVGVAEGTAVGTLVGTAVGGSLGAAVGVLVGDAVIAHWCRSSGYTSEAECEKCARVCIYPAGHSHS